jgi:TM2 domain-containing membrane protein YozV
MSEKNKIAAGVLAIVLGGLGIHHFYLGNTNWGLIYLGVSIVGSFICVGPFIIWILALIDGVKYLIADDAAFNEVVASGKTSIVQQLMKK